MKIFHQVSFTLEDAGEEIWILIQNLEEDEGTDQNLDFSSTDLV